MNKLINDFIYVCRFTETCPGLLLMPNGSGIFGTTNLVISNLIHVIRKTLTQYRSFTDMPKVKQGHRQVAGCIMEINGFYKHCHIKSEKTDVFVFETHSKNDQFKTHVKLVAVKDNKEKEFNVSVFTKCDYNISACKMVPVIATCSDCKDDFNPIETNKI